MSLKISVTETEVVIADFDANYSVEWKEICSLKEKLCNIKVLRLLGWKYYENSMIDRVLSWTSNLEILELHCSRYIDKLESFDRIAPKLTEFIASHTHFDLGRLNPNIQVLRLNMCKFENVPTAPVSLLANCNVKQVKIAKYKELDLRFNPITREKLIKFVDSLDKGNTEFILFPEITRDSDGRFYHDGIGYFSKKCPELESKRAEELRTKLQDASVQVTCSPFVARIIMNHFGPNYNYTLNLDGITVSINPEHNPEKRQQIIARAREAIEAASRQGKFYAKQELVDHVGNEEDLHEFIIESPYISWNREPQKTSGFYHEIYINTVAVYLEKLRIEMYKSAKEARFCVSTQIDVSKHFGPQFKYTKNTIAWGSDTIAWGFDPIEGYDELVETSCAQLVDKIECEIELAAKYGRFQLEICYPKERVDYFLRQSKYASQLTYLADKCDSVFTWKNDGNSELTVMTINSIVEQVKQIKSTIELQGVSYEIARMLEKEFSVTCNPKRYDYSWIVVSKKRDLNV